MADGRCCVNFVRWLVIIFNTIFALCGLTIVGIGIWMLIDNTIPVITDVSTDASDSGDLLRIAAILLIVVGGLLFIISLLGTIGAIIEHKVILGVFMAFLVIIFVGEIVGGVLAIVFKDSLLDDLDVVLRDSLQNYYEAGTCKVSETGKRWDKLQKTLDCCGIETSGSGYNLTSSCRVNKSPLPDSCYQNITCAPPTKCKTWPEGCLGKIEDKVTYYAPILIGIGIGVAMLQTIGIIFATCLCVNVPATVAGYKRHRVA